MGIGTESATLNQLKKAQGETNDRLDALLAEQKRTNQLLEALIEQSAGLG
jgi:septal ring factor EnvC (AmiA/AmiB activator)